MTDIIRQMDEIPGMIFLEVPGEKIYFNQAARQRLGLSQNELTASAWQQFFEKPAYRRRKEISREVLLAGGSQSAEYLLKVPEGPGFRIREELGRKKVSGSHALLSSAFVLEEVKQPQTGLPDLQAFVNSVSYGIEYLAALRDKQGKITDFRFCLCNEASFNMIGRKGKLGRDLIGKRLLEVFPEFPDFEFQKYVDVVEEGASFKSEFPYPLPVSDKSKWYEQSVSRLNDGILLVYDCISGRKKIEQEIKATNELLDSIFDTTNIGIDVVEALRDDQGRVKDFRYIKSNRQALDVHQHFGNADMRDKTVLQAYPALDGSSLFDKLNAVLENGEPYRDELYFEQNGRSVWFYFNYIKFRDGIVITHLDISAAKESSLRLQKSNELVEGILNTASAGIEALEAVRDHKGAIVDFAYTRSNYKARQTQAMLGRKISEGSLLCSLYPKIRQNGLFDKLIEVVEGNVRLQMEVPYSLNGQIRWFLSNYGKSGKDGLILTYVDITAMKKAEEKLKDALHSISINHQNLIRMIDSTDDYIYSVGKDYRLSAFNHSFAREIDQLIGHKPQKGDYLPGLFSEFPEQEKSIHKRLSRALSGQSYKSINLFYHTNGEVTQYDTSYNPVFGHEGQVIGAAAFSRNTTNRQRTEKALKDAREFLLLAENLPQIIFTVNKEGRLEYINRAFSRITGLAIDDIAPENFPDIVHPDDLAPLRLFWQHKVRKGRKVDFEHRFRIRIKEGGHRWMLLKAAPVLDEERQLHSWIASASDIHETIEKERLQRQAAEEFRQIAEGLPQIVWVSDTKGETNYFNKQWYHYTGMPEGEGMGYDWLEALHPHDRKRTNKIWKAAVESCLPFLIEYRLRGSDGKYRWFLARAIPVKDQHERVEKWFGTCTNIEGQKRQQQRLEKQNRQLTELNEYLENFVNAVAHDLRSPVANIKGLIEMLRSTDQAALRKKVEDRLDASIATLDRTVIGLIQLVEAQKQSEAMQEDISVPDCFENVKQEFDNSLKKIEYEIISDIKADYRVHFLRPYLESAFRNLLSNAIKYRKPDEILLIRLGAERGKDFDVISFSDNGIGIDLVKFGHKLFKPFSRFTKHVEGKGVGLHIINQMLRREGGKIEVESEPDKGATFRLYIKR